MDTTRPVNLVYPVIISEGQRRRKETRQKYKPVLAGGLAPEVGMMNGLLAIGGPKGREF